MESTSAAASVLVLRWSDAMDLQARRRAATAIVVVVAAWFFMWFRRRAEEAWSVTYGPMADRDQQRISNLKYIYDLMMLQVQGNMAWYVVYRGKEPRVYRTWAQCNARVSGFKNNSYKSFPTEEEAVASYMEF